MYPYNCARAVRATDATTPSKAREVSQGKTEARKEQNDAKTKTTKSKGDEADSPGKILAGGGFSKPDKALVVAARPTPTERITLESTAPMGQGFGRHPRGGMQIFVKTFKIRYTL